MAAINAKPGYTRSLTVTDAAEVNVIAKSYCQAIYCSEDPTASGWPRGFLVRGPMPGSTQIAQNVGSVFCFPGPFSPDDIAGTLELKSAGGDTSTFCISELSR